MATDLDEQYEKIYRYCYMKIKHRQIAEDLTQETFLRFMESNDYKEMGRKMAYLYTIARNLCADHFRKQEAVSLEEEIAVDNKEDQLLLRLSIGQAIQKLSAEEQELIFLRYVNEVPLGQISRIYGLSRYALYRKMQKCLKKLKIELGKEEHS